MDFFANVDVYFNLHRRVWSLKCRRTGRVVAHARTVKSYGPVKFVVRPAGRARAIREGQKNVHAFVRCDGVFIDRDNATPPQSLEDWARVSYVPSYAPTFYTVADKAPLHDAESVYMVAPCNGPPKCLI